MSPKTKAPQRINVVDPNQKIALDVLAEEIVKVSKSATELLSSRLTKRALLVLLHDKTNVPMKTIDVVLNGASELAREYVRR